MNEPITLEDILIRIESYNDEDLEIQHIAIDDLLVKLVRKLAETLSEEDRTTVQKILYKYDSLDKWYS